MTDWFRSWHGAPTDPKWLTIARRSGVAPGIVSAVAWALFDHASQASPRGSVSGFDVETYAVFSGFDEDAIAAVLKAMSDKGVIVDGNLGAWERRQPKREGEPSTDRVREHRDRKRNDVKRNETHGNTTERTGTLEERRGDVPEASASGASAWQPEISDPAVPERELFQRGKEVLGDNAGGQITRLLKAKGRNVSLARAVIEQADTKANPREYVAAAIRGPPNTVAPGESRYAI